MLSDACFEFCRLAELRGVTLDLLHTLHDVVVRCSAPEFGYPVTLVEPLRLCLEDSIRRGSAGGLDPMRKGATLTLVTAISALLDAPDQTGFGHSLTIKLMFSLLLDSHADEVLH